MKESLVIVISIVAIAFDLLLIKANNDICLKVIESIRRNNRYFENKKVLHNVKSRNKK